MIARRLFVPCVMLGGFLAAGIFGIAPAARAQLSTEYSAIQSQGLIFANICTGVYTTPCECRDNGKCSVRDILQVIVNISYFVFGISGAAALVALIYGGVMFVTSNGNHDRIDKGKKSLAGAFIGLAIIFGSYVTINLVISILKEGEPGSGTIETTIGGDAGDVIQSQ